MKPTESLDYLWARPQTTALAQSLAVVFVERGQLDLVPVDAPMKGVHSQARRESTALGVIP
jgi:hypothetical protein